ncbi:MAG: THxN family PEP-CTERM protein [Amphiplicatus sp.]
MRKILAGLAVGAFAVFATAANAATVSFSNITGAWSNSTGVSPGTFTVTGNGTSTATLAWGNPVPSSGPKSSYVFGAASNTNVNVPPNAQLTLGTFTHNNFPIANPGPELESTVLTVAMNIAVDGNPQGLFNFVFNFDHDETANVGGGNCCNDIVTITNSGLSQNFSVNGLLYTVSILGFQVGGNIVGAFSTVEGQANNANLIAVVSAVPIPGAIPLFLAGLAGLGYSLRRRKAA